MLELLHGNTRATYVLMLCLSLGFSSYISKPSVSEDKGYPHIGSSLYNGGGVVDVYIGFSDHHLELKPLVDKIIHVNIYAAHSDKEVFSGRLDAGDALTIQLPSDYDDFKIVAKAEGEDTQIQFIHF